MKQPYAQHVKATLKLPEVSFNIKRNANQEKTPII